MPTDLTALDTACLNCCCTAFPAGFCVITFLVVVGFALGAAFAGAALGAAFGAVLGVGLAAFGAAFGAAALGAVVPARAVVLPLATIMFHRQNLSLRLYEVLLIRSASL